MGARPRKFLPNCDKVVLVIYGQTLTTLIWLKGILKKRQGLEMVPLFEYSAFADVRDRSGPRRHYNTERPHSALGNLTPIGYAAGNASVPQQAEALHSTAGFAPRPVAHRT